MRGAALIDAVPDPLPPGNHIPGLTLAWWGLKLAAIAVGLWWYFWRR